MLLSSQKFPRSERLVSEKLISRRFKRQIRELYRQNSAAIKQQLVNKNKQIILGIVYTGKPKITFVELRTKINKLIPLLIEQI